MIEIFKDVKIDWLANRRAFIAVSILLMLAGLFSAVIRQLTPGGTEAFNLGVDFKGGTVVTAQFKQRPTAEAMRDALSKQGVTDAIIQPVTDKTDEHMIRVPRMEKDAQPQQQQQPAAPADNQASGQTGEQANGQGGGAAPAPTQAQVDPGVLKVRDALESFGPAAREGTHDVHEDPNAAYKIVGTEAVSAVAGQQLRNQAIAVTLAALVGILIYIAFRFEWTYGAAAVIAVFHDVLVTLGIFSIFQWEISLTVIAALLTLVGFSVNDTIVVFDRIRENRRLHRRDSLYKVTNDSINQTLSRTVITSGLVFLSVLAMVLFGGHVLFGFSAALLVGVAFGTYSSIAIASPIMVWWEQRLEAAGRAQNAPTTGARSSVAKGGGRTQSARRREPGTTGGVVKEPQGAARSCRESRKLSA